MYSFTTTLIQTKKLITPYFEHLLVKQKYGSVKLSEKMKNTRLLAGIEGKHI